MIQRLGSSSLSFKASDVNAVRDAYTAKIDSNFNIAQKQNDVVSKTVPILSGGQIAMQGNSGQKINVVV